MPTIKIIDARLTSEEVNVLLISLPSLVVRELSCQDFPLELSDVSIDLVNLHPLGVMHNDARIEIEASYCRARLEIADNAAAAILDGLAAILDERIPGKSGTPTTKDISVWIKLVEGGYASRKV